MGGHSGHVGVSMESGLEGRNNLNSPGINTHWSPPVSMESGLEGRNNWLVLIMTRFWKSWSQWSPA